MTQVNILEAKNKLSYLIRLIEDGSEDAIIISRNGTPVAQMIPLPKHEKKSFIGIAKGEFTCPDDIHFGDDDISEMFYGEL